MKQNNTTGQRRPASTSPRAPGEQGARGRLRQASAKGPRASSAVPALCMHTYINMLILVRVYVCVYIYIYIA